MKYDGYQIVNESIQSPNILSDLSIHKAAKSLGFEKFKFIETPNLKITQVKETNKPSTVKIDGKAQDIKKLLFKLKNKPRIKDDYDSWLNLAITQAIEGIDSNPKYQNSEATCRVTLTARK